MVFELRHYDTALLRFDAQMDTLAMEAKILWVSEEHRALLPLSLDLAPAKLAQWLKLRIIPQRRENAHALSLQSPGQASAANRKRSPETRKGASGAGRGIILRRRACSAW